MATSSRRLCSDEELHKARDDLRQLIARRRGIAQDSGGGADNKREKKKKKTKTRVLPQDEVDNILSISFQELPGSDNIDRMAKEGDEEMYRDCKTLVTVAGVLTKNLYDIIHAAQDDLRREIDTKGYYAYEVTDDEAEKGAGGIDLKL